MDKETREFLIGMESRLKDYIDKRLEKNNKELKAYFEKRLVEEFAKNNKELKAYFEKRLVEEFAKNNQEIAEELQEISKAIDKKQIAGSSQSNQEIKKELDTIKEKLNRKTKEDKESFKANNARLNKVELTQEYFEVKIDDLKKVNSKVAI